MENQSITEIIVSQYKASLGMLRQTLDKVPDAQWNNETCKNPIWQLAYHVLWATRMYLGPSAESYVAFQNAIEGAESLGGEQDWENPDQGVTIEGFHTKTELLSYLDELVNGLKSSVMEIPLEKPSGFEWYPYSRLELHINNIRHIQHHTAQIIERLKADGIHGFPWWIDKNQPQAWY